MMNHLSDATCELNRVNSSPRTLTAAIRSTVGHAFYVSNWWSRLTVAL
jgi:hypothetical protein